MAVASSQIHRQDAEDAESAQRKIQTEPVLAVWLKAAVQQLTSILWRRIDHPGHESARLFYEADSWNLQGTAVFSHEQLPCRLNYQIVCDSSWHTQSARIDGWVGNDPIQMAIAVNASQRWSLNELEVPDVAGCIDVDLNFSPSTNLLPIRRLKLAIGQESEVRAAWLRFPSFKLEPLVQVYRRVDEMTYRYESSSGAFVTELSVNESGFVIKYPDFWETEDRTTP